MKEYYIIEYLNCKKGFQKDYVKFKGSHAYQHTIKWGIKNLENFNMDMIQVNYLDENVIISDLTVN
jgi:hypothetical protein